MSYAPANSRFSTLKSAEKTAAAMDIATEGLKCDAGAIVPSISSPLGLGEKWLKFGHVSVSETKIYKSRLNIAEVLIF